MASSRAALFAGTCIRSAILTESFLHGCYFMAYKRYTPHTFLAARPRTRHSKPFLNGKKIVLDISAGPTLSGPVSTLATLSAHIWKPGLFLWFIFTKTITLRGALTLNKCFLNKVQYFSQLMHQTL